MAILRAGPWGNITNSFQDVPSDVTADGLTLYPVNCAKTDWVSGQAWGAYYEVTESGCCTPETISITNAYTATMTRLESCYYGDSSPGTPPFFFDYFEQTVEYSSGTWTLYWDSAFSFGESIMTNNDPCDPTGTYMDNISAGNPNSIITTP